MAKKNVIVTGGTKGIGRAIVGIYADKGHHVAFCARTLSDIKELLDELNKNYPNQRFIGYVVDMSDRNQIRSFAQKVLDQFNSIDILINNAGVFLQGSLLEESDDILDMQLNTNLISAYILSKAIAPEMIRHGQGDIINISSIAGITPYPNASSYCISKFAMRGFGLCLREELKDKGIRVMNILPGATWSNSWSGSDITPDRIMPASDIAHTIYCATELDRRSVLEEVVLRPQLGDL